MGQGSSSKCSGCRTRTVNCLPCLSSVSIQSIGRRLEDRYFVQKVQLGKGSFGVVFRAVDINTKEVVALKQIDKSLILSSGIPMAQIHQEVKAMQACDHPNVLRLIVHYEDYKYLSLALEYCDGGDFGDKLKEKASSLGEDEAAEWTKQICGAIYALHSKSICHRDVKPDNFMVSGENPSCLKLADFGVATFVSGKSLLTQKTGTPAFMAPEVHGLPNESKGYRFEVDMWAAGVLLFSLLNRGRHPWLDGSGNLDMRGLLAGTVDFSKKSMRDLWKLQHRCSEYAEAVCRRMVDPNPANRATAQQVLDSPWLQDSSRMKRQQSKDSGNGGNAKISSPNNSSSGHSGDGGNAAPTDLRKQNEYLKNKLDDQAAMLEASKVRERVLLEWIGDKKQALQTIGTEEDQGRLPVGAKCRHWNFKLQSWVPANVSSFNQDGTYNLEVDSKLQMSVDLANIAPRSDGTPEEAWPRGTWVTYRSSTTGKEMPAVVMSFQVSQSGLGAYNLDVRELADVERIRPRKMKHSAGFQLAFWN